MSENQLLKLIKKLSRRLANTFGLVEFYPAYDYVQTVNEQSVHQFLHVDRDDIGHWVIVGGCRGHEIPKILKHYPKCRVTVFECSHRYIAGLRNRFGGNPRVKIIEKAVCDQIGTVTFHETNLGGSGSLLQVGAFGQATYGMEQAEQFEVDTTTLDATFGTQTVDVIQIDVQGAELMVLKGARETLAKAKAVFTEVTGHPDLYQGAATMTEINGALSESGYVPCLLGMDFNLIGNALFVRKP